MSVHPGLVLKRKLECAAMSQKELAARSGISEKLISLVIAGERNMSAAFARKLGYIFEDYKFWSKAQLDYEAQQEESAERNHIDDEEKKIYKEFKIVLPYLYERVWLEPESGEVEKIIELRRFLQISNLKLIPQVTYNAAYRAQLSSNLNINQYVLFAWQRICEKEVEDVSPVSVLNLETLKSSLFKIKGLMGFDIKQISSILEQIFNRCGIAFKIVRNFKGAPVQGFIKELPDKLVMCLTLRGKAADRFWFTLFHEIAHVLNGDYKKRFVDFDSVHNEQEVKADLWARDQLIDPEAYKDFIQEHDKFSLETIKEFADTVNVPCFVIIGRLQKDHYLEYTEYSGLIPQYNFEQLEA